MNLVCCKLCLQQIFPPVIEASTGSKFCHFLAAKSSWRSHILVFSSTWTFFSLHPWLLLDGLQPSDLLLVQKLDFQRRVGPQISWVHDSFGTHKNLSVWADGKVFRWPMPAFLLAKSQTAWSGHLFFWPPMAAKTDLFHPTAMSCWYLVNGWNHPLYK